MTEAEWAARLLSRLHEVVNGTGAAGRAALKWARENRDVVRQNSSGKAPMAGRSLRWADLARLSPAPGGDHTPIIALKAVDAVASIFGLDGFNRELLRTAVMLERLPRLASLGRALAGEKLDMVWLHGCLAGAEPASAAQRTRRSLVVRLGLLEADRNELHLNWNFGRLLDHGRCDEDSLLEGLVGPRLRSTLSEEDFAEHRQDLDVAIRLVRGTMDRRLAGINLLLHGPPGTGKTEFVKTLADSAGVRLFAVGECDEEGDEPTRFDRLHALKRGQRLLGQRSDTVLLFDEMEDLFASPGLIRSNGAGSKVFVNRLLETNTVPTIWTSNSIQEIDPAHLRRMSFILRMDHPSPANRRRIVARISGEEGCPKATALERLANDHEETASVARAALRAAAVAGMGGTEAERIARSLIEGLRGGRALRPARSRTQLDLALYQSDPPVASLVEQLQGHAGPAIFSLLLSGPPGTGKTVLARHIADALDRSLLVRRTSDLLSKWVGETEANIAQAFEQARRDRAILFFDEVDSLLFDRVGARTNWEVTQVNELLSCMDDQDVPLMAATNYAQRLDPAAMRRFDFKLTLHELSAGNARLAFSRFFDREAPIELNSLSGLTPGDFAVVARQLRFQPAVADTELVRLLARELAGRGGASARIGF